MEWSHTSENVITIRMETTGQGWRQPFLKLADVHFDSPFCDRRLLRALLDEALEQNAPVSIYGDWHDAMQSRNDPRRTLAELRKEYAGVVAYGDALVEDSVEFLRPYAPILMHISDGNHDVKMRKYLETDLLERVCNTLGVPHMGYAGFERYMFKKNTGGHKSSKLLFFHHGKEGGVVSKGTQRSARWQEWAVADIYVGGHVHNEWRINRPRVTVAPSGKEVVDETLHISLPTLKNEWKLKGGYSIERAMAPAAIGGAWLVFEHHPRCRNNIHVDALRAR
ncbi:hypothetical protein LCGC14_0387200 [marine sediment metagenome]|uniref:Calcineurin-like phosphoesterase domain-containing protein n=1 Tax=marine sediment metagenome TaxID=412755 RepID=A0A0F9TIX8_9ZZZZ